MPTSREKAADRRADVRGLSKTQRRQSENAAKILEQSHLAKSQERTDTHVLSAVDEAVFQALYDLQPEHIQQLVIAIQWQFPNQKITFLDDHPHSAELALSINEDREQDIAIKIVADEAERKQFGYSLSPKNLSPRQVTQLLKEKRIMVVVVRGDATSDDLQRVIKAEYDQFAK